jgi:RNA polymerase sigma factor (sigma-70 family)
MLLPLPVPNPNFMSNIMNMTGQLSSQSKIELDRIFEMELLPLLDNVYNFALYLCRDREDAADLAQETYLKAYQAIDQYHKGTNAKAWLFRILKNTFINVYRKRTRQPDLVSVDDVFSLQDKAESASGSYFDPQESRVHQSLGDEVTRAVNSLNTAHRVVIILSDIEDFSYEEIAAILNVPVGTVRSRLHRARHMLKEELQTYAACMGYGDNDR